MELNVVKCIVLKPKTGRPPRRPHRKEAVPSKATSTKGILDADSFKA